MKTITLTFALFVLFSLSLSASYKSIRVEVKGEGEPVLLLAGFTCTGEVWNETVAEIYKNKACHIVNYAGFGDVPAIDTLWMESIKQDIGAYIEKEKLEDLTIIGHSMGGTLALWLASQNKYDIKGMMIIDALPCLGAMMMPNYSSESMTYNTPYSQNLLKMSDSDFNSMAQNFAFYMSKNQSKHEQISNWIKQADRKTYVYGYVDLLKMDLRNEIGKINTKVCVLAAANPNKSRVEKNYNAQYAQLKDKDIIYIEDSAHFIMYDQYDVYIQKLKTFLE